MQLHHAVPLQLLLLLILLAVVAPVPGPGELAQVHVLAPAVVDQLAEAAAETVELPEAVVLVGGTHKVHVNVGGAEGAGTVPTALKTTAHCKPVHVLRGLCNQGSVNSGRLGCGQ